MVFTLASFHRILCMLSGSSQCVSAIVEYFFMHIPFVHVMVDLCYLVSKLAGAKKYRGLNKRNGVLVYIAYFHSVMGSYSCISEHSIVNSQHTCDLYITGILLLFFFVI